MFSCPKSIQKRISRVCFIALLFVVLAGGETAWSALKDEPLMLTLNPPSSGSGEICLEHDGPLASAAGSDRAGSGGRPDAGRSTSVRPGSGGRPGAVEHGSGGHGGGSRPVQESEHRPVPVRKYHFSDHRRLADVKAFVRKPDGSVIEPDMHLGVNPGLSFLTPMGDGPTHGAHNVYVVEQGIEDNTLLVRTAKWITMHHSCGWGHDGKFNESLTTPQPLESIPFEIVINNLWDPNFHASVTSGNQLEIRVLSYGKPVPGARVTLRTEKGWSKEMTTDEHGVASMQLIRDYYPSLWRGFKRTYRGKFLVTAEYDAMQTGTFRNESYEQVRYIATLPWKYSPSSDDYSSYASGLLIGVLTMTVSGVGVYAYRERRKRPYRGITFDE